MRYAALVGVGLAVVLSALPAWSADDDDPAPPTPDDDTPEGAVVPTPAKHEASPPAPSPPLLHVEPFVSIVGGLKLDTIIQAPNEHRQARISALAVSDFGIRGTIGSFVSFVSEIMANGGTDLHGSSAWEGQAALQVRQQLVHVQSGPWAVEVGRIIDDASVNFVSLHIGDTLFQDTATRDPLLYAGFNLGNGVRATFEPIPRLKVGLTFTAGNPVSNTASLQIGGSFPPFDRFYIQPFQAVNQSPNNYPDDTFHMMLFAPSLAYAGSLVEAKGEFQGYTVDTNTNQAGSAPIRGYNLRGSVKAKLLEEKVTPFANVAVDRNDTVNPNNVNVLAPAKYTGVVWGGGVDVNIKRIAPGRFDGIGAQYDRVQYQVGNGSVTNLHYVNVGATYWFNDWLAIGARFALWLRNDFNVHDEGERSGLLTMRLVL